MRKNKLENSSTESAAQHLELAAEIRKAQAAVHSALLDNIDTAAAMQHLLGAPLAHAIVHFHTSC